MEPEAGRITMQDLKRVETSETLQNKHCVISSWMGYWIGCLKFEPEAIVAASNRH